MMTADEFIPQSFTEFDNIRFKRQTQEVIETHVVDAIQHARRLKEQAVRVQMDSGMEDSGFDSDQRSQNSVVDGATPELSTEIHAQLNEVGTKSASYKALKKTSELQKKIERQRDLARKSKPIDQQPRKGGHLLSRTRLPVPPVGVNRATEKEFSPSVLPDQCQPLVTIVSDESEEDEFDVPRLPRATRKEITEQLMKDGYNLDLEPDDEDLDLIPPRPLNERSTCCQMHSNCLVQ